MSKKKKDDDYHVGLPHIGIESRPNPFYKADVEKADVVIGATLKQKAQESTCRGCGQTISLLIVLYQNDARKLSHQREWKISYREAAGKAGTSSMFWTSLCCAHCGAKKMRLIALGAPKDVQVNCSNFCNQDHQNEPYMKNYECCQGYHHGKYCCCFDPDALLRSFAMKESCLNFEALFFPGKSMDTTMTYFMDTRDLKPDPTLEQYMQCIQNAEMFKTIFDQATSPTPIAPCAMIVVQFLGLVIAYMKRVILPIVGVQMVHQVEPEDEANGIYHHSLQGRHKENTLFKMAQRMRVDKPYIVKITYKYYGERSSCGKLVDSESQEIGQAHPVGSIVFETPSDENNLQRFGDDVEDDKTKRHTDKELPPQLLM